MKIFVAALSLAFAVAIGCGTADAQVPPGSIKTVSTAIAHSISIPLREMTTCPGAIYPLIPGPKSQPAGDFLSDPIVSFEGLHLHGLAGGNCSFQNFDASDDSGAVGFDYYVQVVNTAIVVYDKQGNVVAGPVSTTTFWANQPACCEGGVCGTDAVVRFDRYANRWVISHPDGGLPAG